MAKWGEGDPRWIVEERADAKNVNNWHWAEKNATKWSTDLLTKLLTGLVVEDAEVFCEITQLSKVEGEAIANNRKAKLIFFFEWVIEGDWKGHLKTGDNKTKFKGKLDIPNLSEENSAEEVDVNVNCTNNTDDAYKVKEFMRTRGGDEIRVKLAEYIKELKHEYSKDLILPSKNGTGDITAPTTGQVNLAKQAMNQPVLGSTSSKEVIGTKIATMKLVMEEEFFCAPDDLYKVFVEKELLRAFCRCDVIVEKEKGGRFLLFGETICGFFDELNPNSLVMRWRNKSWPAEHYSSARLEFAACEGGTKLKIVQTGIPEKEIDSTREGWKRNYFTAIKHTFGYGGRMF